MSASNDTWTGHYEHRPTGRSRLIFEPRSELDTFSQDISQNSVRLPRRAPCFFDLLELGPIIVRAPRGRASSGRTGSVHGMNCELPGRPDSNSSLPFSRRPTSPLRRAGFCNRHLRAGDARVPLPFADDTFDAVICIDSIEPPLRPWGGPSGTASSPRAGGRILFTDPIIVTGLLRRDEIIARSAGMGDFVFTPAWRRRDARHGGRFKDIEVRDQTENMASVAARRQAARQRRAADLEAVEGAEASRSPTDFFGSWPCWRASSGLAPWSTWPASPRAGAGPGFGPVGCTRKIQMSQVDVAHDERAERHAERRRAGTSARRPRRPHRRG